MLEVMGVDSVILVDMLCKESLGMVDGSFFNSQTPVESFNSSKLCVDYYSKIVYLFLFIFIFSLIQRKD